MYLPKVGLPRGGEAKEEEEKLTKHRDSERTLHPQKACSSTSTHLYDTLHHFHWFFQSVHRDDPGLDLPMFCRGSMSIPSLILVLNQKPLPWLSAGILRLGTSDHIAISKKIQKGVIATSCGHTLKQPQTPENPPATVKLKA